MTLAAPYPARRNWIGHSAVRFVGDMGLLFASRASGIVIALIFLPMYARLMSAQDFGVAAVVLTLQAAIQVADLGVSATLARETARHHTSSSRRWRTRRLLIAGERGLATTYLVVGLAVALIVWLTSRSWSNQMAVTALLIAGFAVFTVLNNLFYTALMAIQSYALGSITQATGGFARALLTVAALMLVAPTLNVFVAAQTLALAAHYLLTRYFAVRAIPHAEAASARISWRHWTYVLRQSLPFLVLSSAGAIATQVDKPIIVAGVSAAALAPYFLAYTYAQVPLAVLSLPIVQYFQPRLTADAARPEAERALLSSRRFAMSLTFGVVGPALALLFLAPELIGLWLRDPALAEKVAPLSYILVPGTAVASFAFIPLVLLTLGNDAAFMARLGMTTTALAVGGYGLAVWGAGVEGVAYALLLYEIAITSGFWWRAIKLPATAQLARVSALGIARASLMLAPWCLVFVLATRYSPPWSWVHLLAVLCLGLAYGLAAMRILRTSS